MALFQRQPITVNQYIPYSITLDEDIYLFVGLGNPGKEYDLTRHNVGFMTLDYFIKQNNLPAFKDNKKFEGQLSEGTLNNKRLILLKPTTFMNNSGQAVQKVANFYKIKPENIIAIYDELALPFGQIRTRIGGQDAGHNGVKSLISHLSQNFGRIRIGINNELSTKATTTDFVLKKFTKDEQEKLEAIISEASTILSEVTYSKNLQHETRNVII